jgi:hypothetical protein
MKSIQEIHEALVSRFPNLRFRLSQPMLESGTWMLDVYRENNLDPVVIAWNPKHRFGITTPEECDFGTGVSFSR